MRSCAGELARKKAGRLRKPGSSDGLVVAGDSGKIFWTEPTIVKGLGIGHEQRSVMHGSLIVREGEFWDRLPPVSDGILLLHNETQPTLVTQRMLHKFFVTKTRTTSSCASATVDYSGITVVKIANFTIIGATTDEYKLLKPLRDRVKIILPFLFYGDDDL